MNELSGHLRTLASAASLFGEGLDDWARDFEHAAKVAGLRRSGLLNPRFSLHQLASALQWGPSVGLYGESQCGKSMLVSRFAAGLGALAGMDGSLLVDDPTPDAIRRDPSKRPRWYDDDGAAESGGIDFISWFDPQLNSESTGVICRFTHERPRGVRPGCFLVELITVSELVAALALGYQAESLVKAMPDREDSMRAVLSRLSKSQREPDVERIMPQLLHAWEYLSKPGVLGATERFRILDRPGAQGWDEFVRDCVDQGTRPSMSPRPDGSDLDRLVELLWDSSRSVTDVWRKCVAALQGLGWAERVSVSANDVCRDGGRHSLVSVEWIRDLGQQGGMTCLVEPLGSDRGERAVPAAALVALTRTLVLPLARGSGSLAPLDVIDYPGAITAQGNTDFELHERSDERARYALRRGKIERLFTNSVDYYDSTSLCIAAQAQGNLTGGSVVMKALQQWLEREHWHSSRTPEPPPAGYSDPPLVVAITKADQAWEKAPQGFSSVIQNLEREYSKEPNWIAHWSPITPREPRFTDVYWVHNPRYAKPPLHNAPAGEIEAKLKRCLAVDEVTRYLRNPRERLAAITKNPPEDVGLLFDRLREVTRADRRLGRLCELVAERMVELHGRAPGYIGRGDVERCRQAREAAGSHVRALRETLRRKPHVFSEFLHALSVSPEIVVRAFRRAADATARNEEDQFGVVGFEEFFDALTATFISRIDRELEREARWTRDLAPEIREHLVRQFRRLPSQNWFKGRLQAASAALINDFDPEATNVEALSSVVSSIWNRCMVWLDDLPPAPLRPAELPPRLRRESAATLSILEHWERRLPEVYERLDDPNDCARAHNMRLGALLAALRHAIEAFLAAVDRHATEVPNVDSWRLAIGRMKRLLADLSVVEATPKEAS